MIIAGIAEGVRESQSAFTSQWSVPTSGKLYRLVLETLRPTDCVSHVTESKIVSSLLTALTVFSDSMCI